MASNREKRRDNFDDVIVSIKNDAQAEKNELFSARERDYGLAFKDKNGVIKELEFKQPYLRYLASLNQTGTDAPTAVELINELGGPVVWTRNPLELTPGDSPGAYRAVLEGAFGGYVRVIPPIDSYGPGTTKYNAYGAGKYDNDQIYLTTAEVTSATGVAVTADECLFDGYSFIEFHVYPAE